MTALTVLVDTNVFAYSLESGDDRRRTRATAVLARLGVDRTCVSTQILSELANVVTHPRKLALSAQVAEEAIRNLTTSCRVLPVTPETTIAALRAAERWKLEYFDAQIWATAALHGVEVVLSEDFSHRCVLGGVGFLDPFADDFDLASL